MTLSDLIRIAGELSDSYPALVAELEQAPVADLNHNSERVCTAFLVLSDLSDCAVCEAAYRSKPEVVR